MFSHIYYSYAQAPDEMPRWSSRPSLSASGAAVCWKSQCAHGWVGLDRVACEPPASLGGHSRERVLALPVPHLSLLL